MSAPTPTPSPEQTSDDKEKKPFDPHDFPRDLRDAQRAAAELYAELHALQKRLPWSCEPHEGWPEVKERGQAGREPSPGWKPDEAAAYDQLWEKLRERTAAVTAHGWWKTCKEQGIQGPDLVTARAETQDREGRRPPGPRGHRRGRLTGPGAPGPAPPRRPGPRGDGRSCPIGPETR